MNNLPEAPDPVEPMVRCGQCLVRMLRSTFEHHGQACPMGEVWLRAFFNAPDPDLYNPREAYADHCLAEYKKRFYHNEHEPKL